MHPAPDIPQSVYIQKHLSQLHIDEWLEDDVFQYRWWILLGLIFVSMIIWYILLDKARAKEICLYTAFSVLLVLTLFECGEELILWDYPTDVLPIFPPLSSINLFILTLTFSLIFQYFKARSRFLWAVLASAAIICFIIEPVLCRSGFYELVNWHFYMNYPVYVAMAFIAKFLTGKTIYITEKYRRLI